MKPPPDQKQTTKPRRKAPAFSNEFKGGIARDVARLTDDLMRGRGILRAILAADERGQGVGFGEAMDAAEAFCCDVEARYQPALTAKSETASVSKGVRPQEPDA